MAAAWARIVPAELLLQQLIAMDDAKADLHVSLGWVASATLAYRLEKTVLP
jgi:hypothetical protein